MSEICCLFFFFNDTATTEIYTLSLHDALPISLCQPGTSVWGMRLSLSVPDALWLRARETCPATPPSRLVQAADRKSTRLNSSHGYISYAVFCLKKKKEEAR